MDALFKVVGPEATNSTRAPDLAELLVEELGLYTPSRSGFICLTVCLTVCLTDCLAASVSLLLSLPPSQRILFSATQMFRAVGCAALSCVYNKEVLVWRRREGSKVGE